MKECDNSKIHISSNFILSIRRIITFDTLLLRPSLHCNTPLHFTMLGSRRKQEHTIESVGEGMPDQTLTIWSTVLIDKLIFSQLVKFPTCKGTRLTLSCSQQPSLVPTLSQINPLHDPLILFLKTRLIICPPIYVQVFQIVSSLEFSPQKPVFIYLAFPPCLPHAPSISYHLFGEVYESRRSLQCSFFQQSFNLSIFDKIDNNRWKEFK